MPHKNFVFSVIKFVLTHTGCDPIANTLAVTELFTAGIKLKSLTQAIIEIFLIGGATDTGLKNTSANVDPAEKVIVKTH